MTRYLVLIAFLAAGPAAAAKTECQSESDTFYWVQQVNAGMLQNMTELMNHQVMQNIGQQLKAGQALTRQGKYQEACDVYFALMTRYKFKTMEEAYYDKYPDKRPGAAGKVRDAAPSANTRASESAVDASGAVSGAAAGRPAAKQ